MHAVRCLLAGMVVKPQGVILPWLALLLSETEESLPFVSFFFHTPLLIPCGHKTTLTKLIARQAYIT